MLKKKYKLDADQIRPLTSFCYRLVEISPERELAGWYGFARVGNSVVQLVGYFDSDEDEALAKSLWSIVFHERAE